MSTVTIKMSDKFGTFLSNGAVANEFSSKEVLPVITTGGTIVIDMSNVENMTDSFGNALIANLVANYSTEFFNNVKFANCSDTMKTLVMLAIKFGKNLQS
ncbi:MAG: STAS-like domain-containing protein [Opitutales bacterium]|nr:STAS-like domain-containing protein [Opitutales bacterium]